MPLYGTNPGQQRILNQLDDDRSRRGKKGSFFRNPIYGFKVTPNTRTFGADIEFRVQQSQRWISKIVLLRNQTLDVGSAKQIATWDADTLEADRPVLYSDTSPDLAGKTTYYWLKSIPLATQLQVTRRLELLIGPQVLEAQNLDLIPPDSVIDFDMSKSAGSGGIVTLYASFTAPDQERWGSVNIYVSGYKGVAADVLVKSGLSSPLKFTLNATGEAVTFKCVSVSKGGTEEDRGGARTKLLTLNAAATVPARIMYLRATDLGSAGVQLDFDGAPEPDITEYRLYRANINEGFGASVQIATVMPTGAGRYTYLDAAGNGTHEWYAVAVNAIGASAESLRATTAPVLSSANLPPNVPANNTNYAAVDSILSGGLATIRIYGAATGVGTAWERDTGYGKVQYPAGTLPGRALATDYYVCWTGTTYIATTSYPQTLPDGYIFVGAVHTVDGGGAGGTTGGGGSLGGNGGSRYGITLA